MILTGLVVVLGLNVALSYFVGFRRGRTQRPTEDAVVGMGLSILLAAILLVLLDRVGPGTSPENALGMIALLTIPVSVGFSIGAALAPRGGGVDSEEMQGGSGDLLVAAAGRVTRPRRPPGRPTPASWSPWLPTSIGPRSGGCWYDAGLGATASGAAGPAPRTSSSR